MKSVILCKSTSGYEQTVRQSQQENVVRAKYRLSTSLLNDEVKIKAANKKMYKVKRNNEVNENILMTYDICHT